MSSFIFELRTNFKDGVGEEEENLTKGVAENIQMTRIWNDERQRKLLITRLVLCSVNRLLGRPTRTIASYPPTPISTHFLLLPFHFFFPLYPTPLSFPVYFTLLSFHFLFIPSFLFNDLSG